MLKLPKLIAFVATTDPARARAFYQTVLGLSLISDDTFALVFDVNGAMMRVSKVQQLSPAPYTVLGWEVSDIRAEIAELTTRGVTFERYPGFPQDDLGIFSFPDGTMVAWFKDPDGNTLSLTQFGPTNR